jgi:hypothetical protein
VLQTVAGAKVWAATAAVRVTEEEPVIVPAEAGLAVQDLAAAPSAA